MPTLAACTDDRAKRVVAARRFAYFVAESFALETAFPYAAGVLRIFTALSLVVACAPPVAAFASDVDRAFADAQRAYHKKDYRAALVHLRRYLASAAPDDGRRFGVVEQIARIHLQFEHDPDAAIAFLASIQKNTKLSREHADDLKQWIATAREWKKMGGLDPKKNESADGLFKLGQKFYRRGIADTDGVADETGAASRYIAASYLVPFVQNFDGDKRMAQALLMLGDIRRRSWKDEDDWTEEFYLKEVIRRFPRTKEAKQAYQMLDEDVRMRWSGSGGDHTPDYIRKMLARYKALAFDAAPASKPAPSP